MSEPNGITTCPPWRSMARPMKGETRPPTNRPTEKPPIVKAADQPRSAAISGTVSTGE